MPRNRVPLKEAMRGWKRRRDDQPLQPQPLHNYLCDLDYTADLAEQIVSYWEARGKDVYVWVERFGVRRNGEPLYQIRSDMVNGLPV